MDSPLRTVAVTITVAVICAALLVGVRGIASARIDRNLQIDEHRAVLDALDIRGDTGGAAAAGTAHAVEEAFATKVRKDRGEPGVEQEFDLFAYVVEDEVRGVAIRTFGRGLWGEMRAFVALNPREEGDESWTVRGVVVYRDEETPGLGKRMRDEAFKKRFRTSEAKQVPGLRVLRGEGSASGPYEVDGITAATVTGQGVQGMIDRAVAWYAVAADSEVVHGQR